MAKNAIYALSDQGTITASEGVVFPEKSRQHRISRVSEIEHIAQCLGCLRQYRYLRIRNV
jgi:hypothetical protein